ncbi:MAG TPA: lipid-A-disaccharide synthase [Bacillota bacterium]|nr:lipid-A-disaccharide synthase [Bacillota bacterium]
MKRHIFVSTCEFSGDMHGEVLVKELQKKLPEVRFTGVGGSRMAAAGVQLLYDPTAKSTIGFWEALRNLRRLKKLIKEIVAFWEKDRPDVVIWLDSGGFNLVLAKEAKRMGIPVVCMFSPSAWAYGEDRTRKLSERVRLLLAVLPFEADFYRKFGVNVISVGHPLLDRVKSRIPPLEYRTKLGLDPERKLVALLPGSRRQEVAKLLPVMLETVSGLNDPSLQLVLPVAASIDRDWLESIISQYPVEVKVTSGEVYELMAAADAAIIASGTATLEAAIIGVPMVVIYQVSDLSYFIYKRLESPERRVRPWIGLPNLIAGASVVPEVLQKELTPENVRAALQIMLYDPEVNQRIRQDLQQVREKIGPPGVMARAAGLIADLIENS